MSDFLEKIRKAVVKRVALLPEVSYRQENRVDFTHIFRKGNEPVIIAEIKYASPSKGRVYPGQLAACDVAKTYLASGASALSILTEPDYFRGDVSYINEVRQHFPQVPILLKDFVLSKKQIDHGLLNGANAILLIVAFLKENELKELYQYAIALGLTPIIEVHDIKELEIALKLSPLVIGVNNRNLQTLDITFDISRELIAHIPEECYSLCESGITNRAQIDEMLALGFDGFLIGSSLMKYENPGKALDAVLKRKRYES